MIDVSEVRLRMAMILWVGSDKITLTEMRDHVRLSVTIDKVCNEIDLTLEQLQGLRSNFAKIARRMRERA